MLRSKILNDYSLNRDLFVKIHEKSHQVFFFQGDPSKVPTPIYWWGDWAGNASQKAFIPIDSLILLGFFLVINGLIIIFFSQDFLIRILLGIEVSLLGISLIFINYSLCVYQPLGQVCALLILAVAAVESVIGLGIFLLVYRKNFNLTTKEISKIKG